MAVPKFICVFCGSSEQVAQIYKDAAYNLGKALAAEGIGLIYGGSRMGLMGILADSVMEAGGQVLGFIPKSLHEFEIGHDKITKLQIVETMHDRKRLMFEHSNAFVVLPGGFGTLDETSEIITWRQIHLHTKPIIILNTNNYWKGIFEVFTNHMASEGFIRPEHMKIYHLVPNVEDVVPALEANLEVLLK